jgi:probable phosphoglycerate mutase
LTANGEKRIIATGKALVGDDRLIVPKNLAHIYVSPRTRAQRTLELLGLAPHNGIPWEQHGSFQDSDNICSAKIEIRDDIREWDYGDYEGLTSKTIREQRAERGEGSWDIWADGCPGGESPQQITDRLDKFIAEIRERWHSKSIGKPRGESPPGDVLVVAHGHILRAFAGRWIAKNIADNPSLILEAGGVGTLR